LSVFFAFPIALAIFRLRVCKPAAAFISSSGF
jgi:hypothetical protein